MKKLLFLFDLDSTVTTKEILPTISQKLGKEEEMRDLTEKTMLGEIPFKQSFLERIEILKDIPVSEVQDLIEKIPVNEKLVKFMNDNKDRCFIVTGNLDVWIKKLIKKIGMENNCYCSNALVLNDRIVDVPKVIDKSLVVDEINSDFVAVGDGNNDAEMISKAKIGIGFGGVRTIAPAVLECASHAVYTEDKLVDFLETILAKEEKYDK